MSRKSVLGILAAVAWFGGLLLLAVLYQRRRGVPSWGKGNFPIRYFNVLEWLVLLLTFAVAFTLLIDSLRTEGP